MFDILAAGSLPIYFGAPNIDDFLPCSSPCILNAKQYENEEALAAHVLELDRNPAGALYLSKTPSRWLLLPSLHVLVISAGFHKHVLFPALVASALQVSAGKAAYQRDVEQHTASISSGNWKSRAMDSSRCDSCVLTPSFVECALKYAVDV